MDLTLVTYAAIQAVGFLQIIKNFLPKSFPTWIYAIMMMILSALFTLVNVFLPPVVSSIFMTICISQLGYETILQTVKNFAQNVISKQAQNASAAGSAAAASAATGNACAAGSAQNGVPK